MNMLPKDISFGHAAKLEMLKGIKQLADAVRVTLGPKGRTVIINNRHAPLRITKDGVSVAREFIIKDDLQNIGARILKEAAIKTCVVAGDGTTTATILACELIEKGIAELQNGQNPVALKKGIDFAVKAIVEYLKSISIEITSHEQMVQIATISANGELAIGELIAEAFSKITKSGVITIEESRSLKTTLEIVDGLQFHSGYISPYFVTDFNKMICEFEDAYILLSDNKFSSFSQIKNISEWCARNDKPLVVICDDMELDALETFVKTRLSRGVRVAAVKCPGMENGRADLLQDLSVMTGGTIFTDTIGIKTQNAEPTQLGRAAKVIINHNSTTIVSADSKSEQMIAHLAYLQEQIDNAEDEFHKEYYKTRMSKLTNGIAIIRVGGSNEMDMRERKDRVEDAMHATRAALEEGIVPGGGLALRRARLELESTLVCVGGERNVGAELVRDILNKPSEQIAINAGCLDMLLTNHGARLDNPNIGFDAKNECFVDMLEAGIIDPTKVVRSALEDAAAVALLLLSTEAVMWEETEFVVNEADSQTYRIKT